MVIEEHAALDVITKDGSTYAIDESQIIRGSLTTSQSCSSGGGIPAGSCNTGTASVSFHAPSALPYKKLFGAKVKLYVWYGDTSKKQVGVYNVTSTERSYGVYTLSLSDNVYLLDEACYSDDTTTSAQNWLAMQLGEKRVPSVIFNMICNAYNVPHWNAAKNEEAVPESGNYTLSVKVPNDCCTESVKDFANYLAEYLGAIIMPDENGKLHFAYMGSRTCPITIDSSNIERGTYQKAPFHISTSSWRVNHDSGIWSAWSVSGDLPDNAAPLSIVVNNNPFWQSVEDETPESMVCKRTENMLRYMWVAQGKVAYIDNVPQINPFRCTVHVPYYFRAGDRVKIIDPITSEVYHSYVTDVTWTFRGGQQISCAGEDTRTLSVSTSRNGAKKMSDYSRYLYRKSKSNTGSVEANTYTKSEIDAKDAAVKSAADKAQGTADGAVSVNNTQNTKIASLQKSAHTHSNKGVLDKTEQPYTTAERDKLAGLENYKHPTYTAHAKGFYKFASDGEGHVTDAEKVTKKDITALGIPSENTRYEFSVDGTGLEINQSTSSEFYRLNFPSTRSITSLIPYFPNSYDDGRGFCWCQLAFTVVEQTNFDYKHIGIEGGYEQGEKIRYKPQGVAKITIALYGSSGRRGVSITADLPLHNGKLFELRPLENLNIFSSAPEKKLSVYAAGRYSGTSTGFGEKVNYDLYLFLYADESYTATNPEVKITVETSVYPFGGGCAEVNQNYSNVVQIDSSAISESIRMSAVKTEAVTDILASKADKSEIPDISGKQDKLTAGTNITISGSTISAKDTTYNDATQSAHGLMTAADKKKLDGMDLSKYLPLAGGVMTGNIDMQTNKRDILIGTQPASAYGTFTPVSSGQITTDKKFVDLLPTMRSYMGTYNYKTASIDQWYDLISVRHRNGYGDGSGWGMLIFAPLFGGDLRWNLNTNKDKWQGSRTILDSSNFVNYAAKSNHTHDMIENNSKLIAGANNAAQWCRLGTLVSSGNFLTTVISVWSGDGANGLAAQNSWFEIHIKDAWQSPESATKACGVTVYRTRCEAVKVKVIPTAHDTFTVWVYLPWGYWNGNYAVHGKYSSWTPQVLKQTAEPEGTAADTAYYDQAFLTSTVAQATTLTDSGWIATTRNASFTATSTVKCRKYGQLVEARGDVTFSDTCGSPTVCTLPAGYRPATVVQTCGYTPSGKIFGIKVDTAGVVSFSSDAAGTFVKSTTYRIDLTYLLG